DDSVYESEGYFFFEWYPLGKRRLVHPEQVPPRRWESVTCFGHRCRTVDYVDLEGTMQCLSPVFPDLSIEQAAKICWLRGTKIGGLPSWDHLDDPEIARFEKMTFLCSLSSIIPACETPYPWINDPEPRSLLEWKREEWLYALDGFSMYF